LVEFGQHLQRAHVPPHGGDVGCGEAIHIALSEMHTVHSQEAHASSLAVVRREQGRWDPLQRLGSGLVQLRPAPQQLGHHGKVALAGRVAKHARLVRPDEDRWRVDVHEGG
jgi:hypothetical protein